MRAAVEAAEGGADVAIVSKMHPVRSHSGAAQGGINAALGNREDDSPGEPRVRLRQRLGLSRRSGFDRSHGRRRTASDRLARASRAGIFSPSARRSHRATSVRRRRFAAHLLFGRRHGSGHLAYAVGTARALQASRSTKSTSQPLCASRDGIGTGIRRLQYAFGRTRSSSPRRPRFLRRAASAASTRKRRTATPPRATAWRLRIAPASR